MLNEKMLSTDPFKQYISAVSVGVYQGTPVLDLDYAEDSHAETDMNVVMTESGEFIELQGTAEEKPFTAEHLQAMLDLAKTGTQQLVEAQKACVEKDLKHLGF